MSRLLNAPYTEQQQRRQGNLVSPYTFDVSIGATETTIYTGIADQSLLIRTFGVIDDTVGAITLTVNVGGNQWFTQSITANQFLRISALEGFLIPPSVNITATGENLRIVGWGLRVQGGDGWTL